MRIVCPQCGYSRDIPADKVPARSSIATCPKCHFRFRFRGLQAQSSQDDAPDEPVYPPRPSRPAVEQAPPAYAHSAPFEPRNQRLYAVENPGEPEHYGHLPPRPQARWLPDPEPSRPVETAEQELPDYGRLGEPAPNIPPHAAASAPTGDTSIGPAPEAVWAYEETSEARVPLASPVIERTTHPKPSPDEHEPLPPEYAMPEPDPTDTGSEGAQTEQPQQAEVQPSEAVAGEDSVRDIWARLQAMGGETKVAAGAYRQPEGEPVAPAAVHSDSGAPWEQLEHYGVVPAFLNTIKSILLKPGDFFDQLPPVSGKLRPLIFAMVLCVVSMLFGLIWNYFGLGPNLSELGRTDGFQGLGAGALGGLALLGLSPIVLIGFVFLDAALAHLLLGLLRSATRPFDETFRTICYSGGPWILTALPVPYSYLIPVILIWHMTLQAIGLKKLHQGGYPQVLASVLVKWSLFFMASFAILHVLITRR